MTRSDLHQRRLVAFRITAFLRPDDADEDGGRGAFTKRDTSILVVYGHGRGDFQTLSFDQARDYLTQLTEGAEPVAPWKLGIR